MGNKAFSLFVKATSFNMKLAWLRPTLNPPLCTINHAFSLTFRFFILFQSRWVWQPSERGGEKRRADVQQSFDEASKSRLKCCPYLPHHHRPHETRARLIKDENVPKWKISLVIDYEKKNVLAKISFPKLYFAVILFV